MLLPSLPGLHLVRAPLSVAYRGLRLHRTGLDLGLSGNISRHGLLVLVRLRHGHRAGTGRRARCGERRRAATETARGCDAPVRGAVAVQEVVHRSAPRAERAAKVAVHVDDLREQDDRDLFHELWHGEHCVALTKSQRTQPRPTLALPSLQVSAMVRTCGSARGLTRRRNCRSSLGRRTSTR